MICLRAGKFAPATHARSQQRRAALTVARKPRPAAAGQGAVWIVCRMGSDAGSLGRVCYRAVNGRIREDPGTGGARVHLPDGVLGAGGHTGLEAV